MSQELNLLDNYNYARNLQNSYSCFLVGVKTASKIPKDTLFNALSELVSQRVSLRTIVNSNEQFQQIEFDSKDVVEFWDSDDLVESIRNAHELTFPAGADGNKSLPLWKLIVLKSNWLLFVCDHILYDGTTGSYFVQDLISILNKHDISKDTEFRKEYEQLYQPSIWYVLKTLGKEFIPNPLKYWAKQETQDVEPKFFETTTKDISTFKPEKYLIKLNNEQVMKLKSILKPHDVSITALLAYLNSKVLSKFTNGPMKASIPVNLRKFFTQDERPYGVYVTGISLKLKPTETKDIDWDYVRFIKSQLSKEAQLYAAQIIGVLKYVNAKDFLRAKLEGPRSDIFEVSNLGVIDNNEDKEDEFKVEDYIFSQPNNKTQGFITNEVISKKGGFLNILVSGAPEIKQVFLEYATELEKELHSFSDS